MTDGGAVGEDGVFDFDSLSDVAVVANGGGAAEVAVGADFAVCANDDGALDEDAGEDFGAFADDGFGTVAHLDGGVAGPVLDVSHEELVEIEKIPRIFWIEGVFEFTLPLGEGFAGDEEGGFIFGEGPEGHGNGRMND